MKAFVDCAKVLSPLNALHSAPTPSRVVRGSMLRHAGRRGSRKGGPLCRQSSVLPMEAQVRAHPSQGMLVLWTGPRLRQLKLTAAC